MILTTTYGLALAALVAGAPTWHSVMRNIAIASPLRRTVICGYWVLACTILADIAVALGLQGQAQSQMELKLLLAVAFGTIPQVVLLALVVTPIAMRGRFKEYPFTRALLIMESCAAVAIVMLILALIGVLRRL
jgi:hypothetical protein